MSVGLDSMEFNIQRGGKDEFESLETKFDDEIINIVYYSTLQPTGPVLRQLVVQRMEYERALKSTWKALFREIEADS